MTAYRMGRAAGYTLVVGPDHGPIERDTLSCVHCGGHWFVEPKSGHQRGWCFLCKGPHCGQKNCWSCVPLERRLEILERRARLAEAAGLQMK